MFLQHDRLADVQPADLVRVAKAYFKPSNRTVGYYIPDMAPDRTVVPATPDLDANLRSYTTKVSACGLRRSIPPSPTSRAVSCTRSSRMA